MQQSEISLDIPATFSSQEDSFELLIGKFFLEENLHKKNEIYRKIEMAIIKNENINSAEINQKMADYFSKITEPKNFDKKLIKLMLTSGWKVPQDFRELDSLNIKECPNDFFLQDVEIKIQDYKKTYETSPITIEERYQKEFFKSLEIAFEYLGYCTNSSDRNEVEYNKKNMLRIDVNGVKLGFSAIGLYDFLENIELKKDQEKISFEKFISKLDNKKEKQGLEEDFMFLETRCLLDRQIITDPSFSKEFIEQGVDVRSSVELSRRGSSQNFSSVRASFQESSSRRNSFQITNNQGKILKLEGDKFVIKDPDPTCFSFLKTMFCNCFGKKNQQQNSGQNQDSRSSSDHSLHPSNSFISSPNASLVFDQRGIILN
jgi:hypothetical protein